ncbi:MAG TPA: enoyl-CoA hydratase/isomerase family protein [Rhizomicrobium sp.]
MSAFGNPASRAEAEEQVLFVPDRDSGIAQIVLNRPAKRNALSVPMRERMASLVRACELDAAIKVVLFRGNGPSFCSGNELNEDWGQRTADKRRFTLSDAVRYGTDMTYGRQSFTQAITRCSKITLLEMHGYCAAAAYFMIATHCDLVVAQEDAKIGAIEGRFLGPAGAVSHIHLNRILGVKAARHIGYTAEPVSGREMFEFGLVHKCVGAGADVHQAALEVAAQVAASPAARLRFLKARIKAAEGFVGASMPAMPGLLVSHFLKSEPDELDFWKAVRTGGVGQALNADKTRARAPAGGGKSDD